ncbi:hypothetical protein CORC01_07153 [Colletotrichum orchidophilum]|uniref:Uncharacterized protein n=1 Tax=Colletotrichum orchidophilum TaxID=1209926 RepID=A0A1G4B7W1_9PEZI|nr:uncharacterized protein CORC01_07153 [Colletotrichum orchidophilum]OHE97538.1 hypothetical protein CORC01_07153 [Colletotrichum orchidophilum]
MASFDCLDLLQSRGSPVHHTILSTVAASPRQGFST